jgi:hypothetical protein
MGTLLQSSAFPVSAAQSQTETISYEVEPLSTGEVTVTVKASAIDRQSKTVHIADGRESFHSNCLSAASAPTSNPIASISLCYTAFRGAYLPVLVMLTTQLPPQRVPFCA